MDNRFTNITTALSTAGPVASCGYQLNALGQRTQATLADNSYWKYGYDGRGEVTGGGHYWSDDNPISGQQFGYGFDGIGNRTSTTTNGRSATYTPNALNQYSRRTVPGAVDVLGTALPSATVSVNGTAASRKGKYFYDTLSVDNSAGPVFAPVTVQGAASGQTTQESGHVYVPSATESYGYDTDGNLTQDDRWQYGWDGENRLISLQTTATAAAVGAPAQQLLFTYDDQGRRIRKQVLAWANGAWQPSTETRFVYDGWNLVAELNGNNALQRSYIWGLDLSGSLNGAGGVGGLIVEQCHNGPTAGDYFPAYDGNGNVVSMLNAKDGHARAEYEYGAFGEVVRASGSLAGINPFQFSTKFTDTETALNYYGYRYYNPSTARWLNRDPIGDAAFFQFASAGKGDDEIDKLANESLKPSYLFVLNSPLDSVDALGQCKIQVHFVPLGYFPPGGYTGISAVQWYHAYITTACGSVEEYFRAGPSGPGPGGSGRASGGLTNSGNWGVIVTNNGFFNFSGAVEQASASEVVITILDNPEPCTSYNVKLLALSWQVDAANIPYKPRGPNSNSFAGSGVRTLGLSASPPIWAPGWDMKIP